MRRSRPLALALASLTVLVTGCGEDSDDGPSEAALRKQLKAAAAKVAGAESVESTAVFETGSTDLGDREPAGCVEVVVDRDPPGSLDLRAYDLGCGGSPDAEVIAIGRRAWTTTVPDRWTEVRVPPTLLEELSDERGQFDHLFAVATEIEETGDRSYEFGAPAAAFFQETDDLGDPTYRAEVDSLGYLSSLEAVASRGAASVFITTSYENFNGPQDIAPPPAAEIVARHSPIHDEAELEEILEATL